MSRPQPLARSFYSRDSTVVAPELLNKVLVVGDRSGRIVEVEAYRGETDPASHAYRGRTPRNRAMFGPPGHVYVYFTYGMHWCANAVCMPEGEGQAVLIRALDPLTGEDAMWVARPAARRRRDLCSGPARLCQALGVTGAHDGADLVRRSIGSAHGAVDGAPPVVTIVDDGTPAPELAGCGTRVGITLGTEAPWRWWVPGNANVSARRAMMRRDLSERIQADQRA
jgi:DNA-3-methyladenine glycosylase